MTKKPKVGVVIPNPGSDEALEQGCKCPRLDNNRGKGIHYSTGSGGEGFLWWQSEDCPLHGKLNRFDRVGGEKI
jgi:hypothetical protein